jgi:beta-xylosidase
MAKSVFFFVLVIISVILSGCHSERVNTTDSHQQEIRVLSSVWNPDNGDGTYRNPIIYADYSDPDACRAGDDFYLVSSSFNCVPALPILHSRDLVNWSLIGYALDRLEPEAFFNRPQHGNGVFAPTIRFHNDEFYIYYGDPDFGIFVLKASDPAGKWSAPVLVKPGKGLIDPCPLWDSDGRVYLTHAYAASRSGMKSILVVNELNSEGTAVIKDEVLVFDGHDGHPIIEGPKFYKRNGYYYIFAPAGSVKTGWQTILRSKNIYGPYEDKIVLHQGSTNINGPHQGAWLEYTNGDSWFLHFQDMEAYGRVVHLQPMHWIEDWPVMGIEADGDGTGEPVWTFAKPVPEIKYAISGADDTDEFNADYLQPQWQWHGNPKPFWAIPSPAFGVLRMNCQPLPDDYTNMWDLPNLLLQKFAAPEFKVTTKFSFNSFPVGGDSDKAGLIIMGRDYAYLSVEKRNGSLVISQAECTDAMRGSLEVVHAEVPAGQNELYFRVSVGEGAVCEFSYSTDGIDYVFAGKIFSAVPGRWIGAKVGLFAVRRGNTPDNGFADFDWFRVEKL